jgi:hypothetical protein
LFAHDQCINVAFFTKIPTRYLNGMKIFPKLLTTFTYRPQLEADTMTIMTTTITANMTTIAKVSFPACPALLAALAALEHKRSLVLTINHYRSLILVNWR